MLHNVEWPYFLVKETAGKFNVTQLCDFNEFFEDIDPDNVRLLSIFFYIYMTNER